MQISTIVLFSLVIGMGFSATANADFIDNFSLPYVLEPLSESQIKNCESIHKDFDTLPDVDFYGRYQTNNIAGNCVMLYEDLIWSYDGLDRYEIISEKSVKLVQDHEIKIKQQSHGNFYIDAKSITALQIPGTFLLKFQGCTGDQTINLKNVSVVSDKETVLITKFVGEERVILPGVCNFLEIQIKADNPDSIRIVLPMMDNNDTLDQSGKIQYKSPKAQLRDGIVSNEVICKEGFKLLLKTSNGSPACVTESHVEKLIQRDWGKLV